METLFALFLREKKYLKNVSPNTIDYLDYCFKVFQKHGGELTKTGVQQFVITAKEAGISTGGLNAYIRGLNSFFTWLFENGHTSDHLKIKHLKQEKRVMKTFSDESIKKLVAFKPQTFYEHRMHAILCLMIDTGVRIDEVLTLTRDKVDFENLLVTVIGKGNKERIVPISIELRKVLWRWLQKHPHFLVFCAKHGGKLLYDNMRREFMAYLEKAGVEKTDGTFHAFRRKFARSYVRNGGNLFYLMKSLGHTTLKMSQEYVAVETEDLQATHLKTSLLSRLR